MDITDYKTNTRLYNLDEAEQNTVLLSLTNKLYQMIVAKIDDVEKGDIPKSRGDITRLPKYNQLKECAKHLLASLNNTKKIQLLLRLSKMLLITWKITLMYSFNLIWLK